MIEARKLCRHCDRRLMSRPRGLCFACSLEAGIRSLYPSTSKFASRGHADSFAKGKRLPDQPTDAEAGSPEKIAVLEQRAKDGVSLWHPHDAGNEMAVKSPERSRTVRILGAKLLNRDRVTFHKQRFGG